MRVCDSLIAGMGGSCSQGRARTKPKKDFQPCRQAGLTPGKGSGESHCQQSPEAGHRCPLSRVGQPKVSLCLALAVP